MWIIAKIEFHGAINQSDKVPLDVLDPLGDQVDNLLCANAKTEKHHLVLINILSGGESFGMALLSLRAMHPAVVNEVEYHKIPLNWMLQPG